MRAWSETQSFDRSFVSAVTLLELERGVLSVARRDPVAASRLRSWLEDVLIPGFEGRILPVDATIARACAALHVPNPRPELDPLIAATALVHGLTVVTRDVAEFAPIGVPVLNPWNA